MYFSLMMSVSVGAAIVALPWAVRTALNAVVAAAPLRRLGQRARILRAAELLDLVKGDARLERVRGLNPFRRAAAVDQVECPRARAPGAHVGDRLVEQRQQVAVDLQLRIEVRR